MTIAARISPDQLVERIIEAPAFAGIPAEKLLPLPVGVRLQTHQRGELVSQPGVVPAALRILIAGRVCLYEVTPEGRRLVLEYMEPGDADGMLELAGLARNFSVAETSCEVASIGADALNGLIQRIPELGSNLFGATIHKLHRRQAQLQQLCLRDPSQRLAAQLLAMAQNHAEPGSSVTWVSRVSHEGLADMLALRRETVTLHLGRLRRLNLVRVEGEQFLLDVPGLNAVVEGFAPRLAAQPIRSRTLRGHAPGQTTLVRGAARPTRPNSAPLCGWLAGVASS
jgi:CRP/FNR family transcriptional regulator